MEWLPHQPGSLSGFGKRSPCQLAEGMCVGEKEVSGLKAQRFEGCLLLQRKLACLDRSSDPVWIVVLLESLGGP